MRYVTAWRGPSEATSERRPTSSPVVVVRRAKPESDPSLGSKRGQEVAIADGDPRDRAKVFALTDLLDRHAVEASGREDLDALVGLLFLGEMAVEAGAKGHLPGDRAGNDRRCSRWR